MILILLGQDGENDKGGQDQDHRFKLEEPHALDNSPPPLPNQKTTTLKVGLVKLIGTDVLGFCLTFTKIHKNASTR